MKSKKKTKTTKQNKDRLKILVDGLNVVNQMMDDIVPVTEIYGSTNYQIMLALNPELKQKIDGHLATMLHDINLKLTQTLKEYSHK